MSDTFEVAKQVDDYHYSTIIQENLQLKFAGPNLIKRLGAYLGA